MTSTWAFAGGGLGDMSSVGVDYGALHYVANRLLGCAEMQSRGADVMIRIRDCTRWVRKHILEAAGLL